MFEIASGMEGREPSFGGFQDNRRLSIGRRVDSEEIIAEDIDEAVRLTILEWLLKLE